jgi:hypothetical protein
MTVVLTIADQPAVAVPRGDTSIGRHGSEHHSVRGFSGIIMPMGQMRGGD